MQEQRRQVYSVSGFRAAAAGRGISRELHGTSPRRGDALLRHDLPLRADEDRLSKPLPRTNGGIYTSYVLRVVRVPETALMASSRDTIVSVEPPVVSDLVRGKFAQWNKGGQPPCS